MSMKSAIAASLLLALCIQPAAFAADAPTLARLHKAVGTAIDWNGAVTAIPVGTTVIDTTTVKCGAASGCIIRTEIMAQVISNGVGQWQICARVDGNQAAPGCPVQGVVPTSNYVVGNLRTNTPVATGTHTVSFEVVMPSSGSIAAWEGDYTVFKN
jgi:hypothetical protein